MEFDNSWRAVFSPGSAKRYFDPLPAEPPAAISEFSAINAWWLAELSRLVYRHGPPGEGGARDTVLAQVGLAESHFFQRRGTQCAIVEPRAAGGPPIRALVFRGTERTRADWSTNTRAALTDWPPGGQVHAGFKRALDDVWSEIEAALDSLAGPAFYTGHSLGGALAVLAAGRRAPLAVYALGSPRVGDADHAETLRQVAVYRLVNRKDSVPGLPPNVPGLRYRHAGELHEISVGEVSGRKQFPPLPGGRRWFDPPAHLCDHAPVNYVACLERLARGQRR